MCDLANSASGQRAVGFAGQMALGPCQLGAAGLDHHRVGCELNDGVALRGSDPTWSTSREICCCRR